MLYLFRFLACVFICAARLVHKFFKLSISLIYSCFTLLLFIQGLGDCVAESSAQTIRLGEEEVSRTWKVIHGMWNTELTETSRIKLLRKPKPNVTACPVMQLTDWNNNFRVIDLKFWYWILSHRNSLMSIVIQRRAETLMFQWGCFQDRWVD